MVLIWPYSINHIPCRIFAMILTLGSSTTVFLLILQILISLFPTPQIWHITPQSPLGRSSDLQVIMYFLIMCTKSWQKFKIFLLKCTLSKQKYPLALRSAFQALCLSSCRDTLKVFPYFLILTKAPKGYNLSKNVNFIVFS